MAVIAVDQLVKRYGPRTALHGISLDVPAGSLFGFLGPNGAGKSTMIRILLGLLRATSGAATVFGRDVWTDGPAIRRDVGYLPGDVRFDERMTGRRFLEFVAAARGIDARAECDRLIDRFELDVDKRIQRYSRGMKQKLGVIQALMHRPRLLVLDEPTTALDPLMQNAVYDELKAVAAEGRTVLFSSHTLSEVELLCDEVAILREGRIVERERVAALRRRALRHVEIALESESDGLASPPDGLQITQRHGEHIAAVWRGPVAPLLGWLTTIPARDVWIAPPDLEELFLTYYDAAPAVVSKRRTAKESTGETGAAL